jgi:hypothetical protein
MASHGLAREENSKLFGFKKYSLNQGGRAMQKNKNGSNALFKTLFIVIAVSFLTIPILSTAGQKTKNSSYSPYVGQDLPKNVYFGDTHLHTSISLDAYGDGNTKVGPDEAYRWAKGGIVASDDGMPTRISRPLDFLMVADHAEYLGLVPGLARKDPLLLKDPEGARWAKMIEEGKLASEVFSEFIHDVTGNKPRMNNPEFSMNVWKSIIDAAEAHNEPGRFTAFIGYEWSPFPNGNNMHRVVVFKDGKNKTGQVIPFSSFDSQNPEDFWAYLKNYEEKTGGSVLAIPHNGNISGGQMFSLVDFVGNPLTRDYAEKRMRWEPLYEVTQYKGDGETHPYLSPDDQFADFETWDKANLAMLEPHKDEYYRTEYARSALQLGLQQESKLGTNPFKFGMIGATDSHTGFAQTAEDNFLGKYGVASPNPKNKNRWEKVWPPVEGTVAKMNGWESQSAGLAAVWATENTREAIWDAMKRKEVYATTGPRMKVRMFGGFDFTAVEVQRNNMVAIGYAKGVPMGGDLTNAPQGKAPTFLLAAAKDPDGANLDRIQVIKGWLDSKGKVHEKIYDVAVSDDREIVDGQTTQKIGSTVELATATYTNSIGEVQLSAWWVDPDFDPAIKSFYYARVIEIPTPRWTAFDEVRLGIKMDPEVTRVLQERAYTSPIWYTP